MKITVQLWRFAQKTALGIVVLSNINLCNFAVWSMNQSWTMLENKPFPNRFSFELFLDAPGSLAVLALVLLLFNLYRWNKYSMKIGIILKPLPILRLIIGIGLSYVGSILVQKYYWQIHLLIHDRNVLTRYANHQRP